MNMLDEVIDILGSEQIQLKKSNQDLVHDFDDYDKLHADALKFEYLVTLSLGILLFVRKNVEKISNTGSIPEVLPSTIPMIRTVSARLFEFIPNCNQKLSEISVHLGSIVVDSAALTTVRFDFSQSNYESSSNLNEVKLMVDSKLSKQYPNLDFLKLCNT